MNDKEEVTIPIIREEAYADVVPVVTGGVRVSKHTQTVNQILEQELRKSNVEVKRVPANRIVDGPQPLQRLGSTLVIPVVSEILKIEKQWVVTEEIYVTQVEEREVVQHNVSLDQEVAVIERVDSAGSIVSSESTADVAARGPASSDTATSRMPASLLARTSQEPSSPTRSEPRSMLKGQGEGK